VTWAPGGVDLGPWGVDLGNGALTWAPGVVTWALMVAVSCGPTQPSGYILWVHATGCK
jgi:hypothetical protein